MTPEVEKRILDDWHRNVKRVIAGRDRLFYPDGWAKNGLQPMDFGPMLKSEVLETVWHITGIDPGTLKSSIQTRPVARARFLAYWLYRHVMHLSYPAIGSYLKRDHSTIGYGYRRALALLATDKEFIIWREKALGDLP